MELSTIAMKLSQLPWSYHQLPWSYHQLPWSYHQLPWSYHQLPWSYLQSCSCWSSRDSQNLAVYLRTVILHRKHQNLKKYSFKFYNSCKSSQNAHSADSSDDHHCYGRNIWSNNGNQSCDQCCYCSRVQHPSFNWGVVELHWHITELQNMVTWSCLEFPFVLVPTSIFLAWSSTAGSQFETMWAVFSLVSLKELVF